MTVSSLLLRGPGLSGLKEAWRQSDCRPLFELAHGKFQGQDRLVKLLDRFLLNFHLAFFFVQGLSTPKIEGKFSLRASPTVHGSQLFILVTAIFKHFFIKTRFKTRDLLSISELLEAKTKTELRV